MPSRTINVTEDAYTRLSSLKKEGESFSEVVYRLTGKYLLRDLIGILTPEQVQDLRDGVHSIRERGRQAMDARVMRQGN